MFRMLRIFRVSVPLSRTALASFALPALVLLGCNRSADPEPGAQASQGGRGAPKGNMAQVEAIPVEISTITRGPISAFLSFSSTLESEAAVDIFPQTGGQVEALMVEEGQIVKAGDPLLQTDDREVRVDLQDSEINLRFIETSYGRNEEMFNRGLINQQEFDNQRFQLEQARLRYERAKIRMEYTTVRAPFDGVIASRDVQLGARVGTGTKLFTLVSLDDIVARVHVPGRYLAVINEGQAAVVGSEYMPGVRFESWVKRISPVIDPQSGTFRVTVGVRDQSTTLRPGLFVNVQIVTETRSSAVLIPKRALVYDGGQRYVFAVIDGQAVRRRLDAGFEDLQNIEALSGFEAGTQVVVLGQNGLRDGAPVRVVVAPAVAPQAAATAAAAPSAAKSDS